jgi:hypothetical protein
LNSNQICLVIAFFVSFVIGTPILNILELLWQTVSVIGNLIVINSIIKTIKDMKSRFFTEGWAYNMGLLPTYVNLK